MLATYVIETVGTQEYDLAPRAASSTRFGRPTATTPPPRSSPHLTAALGS